MSRDSRVNHAKPSKHDECGGVSKEALNRRLAEGEAEAEAF